MKPDLCYIYGPPASGKGVLARLLDGHPRLNVSPIHDAFPRLLTNLPRLSEIEKEEIYYRLRKALSKTRYYRLEDFSYYASFQTEVSAEYRPEQQIDLNFYKMEQDWTAKVEKCSSVIDIIREIFDGLFKNLDGCSYSQSNCRYYVGMGSIYPAPMENLVEQDKDTKVVFIRRDPRAAITAKGSRPHKKSIEYYVKSGAAIDAEKHIRSAIQLKKKHPDQILMTNFEDLILDTRETMKKIANFMNIRESESLYHPSFYGNELTPKSAYIGEIKDDWKELASEEVQYALDLQMGNMPRSIDITGMLLYIRSMLRLVINSTYAKSKKVGKKLIDSWL